VSIFLFSPVTLIGAHTLGHVDTSNSGYGFKVDTEGVQHVDRNAWDETPAQFDNLYFRRTLAKVRVCHLLNNKARRVLMSLLW
jgi:hypothetical protein